MRSVNPPTHAKCAPMQRGRSAPNDPMTIALDAGMCPTRGRGTVGVRAEGVRVPTEERRELRAGGAQIRAKQGEQAGGRTLHEVGIRQPQADLVKIWRRAGRHDRGRRRDLDHEQDDEEEEPYGHPEKLHDPRAQRLKHRLVRVANCGVGVVGGKGCQRKCPKAVVVPSHAHAQTHT